MPKKASGRKLQPQDEGLDQVVAASFAIRLAVGDPI
jgi:hypothetical protein